MKVFLDETFIQRIFLPNEYFYPINIIKSKFPGKMRKFPYFFPMLQRENNIYIVIDDGLNRLNILILNLKFLNLITNF